MYLTRFRTLDGTPIGLIATETDGPQPVETGLCSAMDALPAIEYLIRTVAEGFNHYDPAGVMMNHAADLIRAVSILEGPKPKTEPE